ncbi:Ubiquitin carboxyl-terminal hydrolase 14 [Dendrobium catenatum]|uniref:Ubiquitin carboxyl-terminal hydrolase n=1 Tax=Dendrobium catenatum TaxID=906689 RepID=A0A2I0WXP4_9ASPA|nr:Ubiquitin carboxyl-terminal hydrolase 14 [Dendrobium catenatum]
MELLRSHLSRVRIPEPTNRIYKNECCVSFDTPKSDGGLYVDLCSFLAFGKEYVLWNYEKTGNPVYLHIQQRIKPVPEDRPFKKPTLLAIGVEGGFDNQEPEYEEIYHIVILPDYIALSFPSVELPEKVRLSVNAVLLFEGAERKEQLASWTSEKKKTSDYAMNLEQINNGVIIPPSGWKCSMCEKTDNLWLNLTDGVILCGRKNWDGSGGNNHAIEHYLEKNYPLAVKLGTLSADLEKAGAKFYVLRYFKFLPCMATMLGNLPSIFSLLVNTEMTTAEKELDQNMNFDWNRIQESGQELEPLFGPGYTGLVNLGNSCYMASTMQVVFSTRFFIERYYKEQNLKSAFILALADPTLDLNMQLINHEVVRPRVPLEACLKCFSEPEEVHDFYSTALNEKTTAIKTAGFTTFPDYLVLHMRKFVLEEGWVPKKLDVYIDVPDIIDITRMRSKGIQSGEELLPEKASSVDENKATHIVPNEDIVSQLAIMGFNYLHCQKAAINTSNIGVEEAMNWLLAHMDDPDIDDPIHYGPRDTGIIIDEASVETLISFGFEEVVARKALKASGGIIEKATDWIFNHPEATSSTMDTDATTSSNTQTIDGSVPDGNGRYKLLALVSHIGTSTHCGHYVAHVRKEGRWVIFNDSKVGASVDPPIDMGYLYFFERFNG